MIQKPVEPHIITEKLIERNRTPTKKREEIFRCFINCVSFKRRESLSLCFLGSYFKDQTQRTEREVDKNRLETRPINDCKKI